MMITHLIMVKKKKNIPKMMKEIIKIGEFDDVNRLVIRSKRRLKDVYANNI